MWALPCIIYSRLEIPYASGSIDGKTPKSHCWIRCAMFSWNPNNDTLRTSWLATIKPFSPLTYLRFPSPTIASLKEVLSSWVAARRSTSIPFSGQMRPWYNMSACPSSTPSRSRRLMAFSANGFSITLSCIILAREPSNPGMSFTQVSDASLEAKT